MIPAFHLAFPVTDLASARTFYEGTLGCSVGRQSDRWIDFDFYGHQITAHLVDEGESTVATNAVDGVDVPVRHFGMILPWEDWHRLMDRLQTAGTNWLLQPQTRFEGQPGEQATAFLLDPCGNGLEFKSFRDACSVFATQNVSPTTE